MSVQFFVAKTKEQKAVILEKLQNAFKNASSAVFVHFSGLSVSDEGEMRENLKENNARYFVAKKTLINRALGSSDIAGEAPELEGEIAVVYNTDGKEADPTFPARKVHEFSKQFEDGRLSIVGGVFEGSFKDKEAMNEIATIPPVEVLRGMFVNVINSPIQGLVVALNQIAEKKT